MKLIFFDIDGTLINSRREMEESTARAIQKAGENGHLCFVNTGRTASLVMDWLPELAPFDGYLCGCGTEIFFRDQVLMHKTLTAKESLEIIRGLEENRIDAILEGEKNDFHNDLDKMHTEVFRNYILERYRHRHWGTYEEAPGNFEKFFCYADDPASVYRFMETRGHFLDLIDREEGYFEIVPKGHSKATAMDFLVNHLNQTGIYPKKIIMEDVVAIGDSNNDLPMLEHAGTAIAMGNSSAAVLRMANYVTAPVMQGGIWQALDWLGCL